MVKGFNDNAFSIHHTKSINQKINIKPKSKVCTFYGYLPLCNRARALTPRSGNVDQAKKGGKRQDEPEQALNTPPL